MTWTYNSSNLSSSGLSAVRLLVGDTSSGDQLLQDEEINYFVDTESGTYYAASAACDAIAASFSRKVDKAVGDLRISLSQRAEAYAERAKELKRKASLRAAANIYAGGISVSDKDTIEADTDRVEPAFTRRMMENPGSVLSSTAV